MDVDSSGARILVVDDDAATIAAVETMLGASGHTVRGAANGAVGLELVLTFRPEVVVFDFWMPVADGREFLQGIREVAKARVGVVVMSGTPEVEEWCTRVGVTQFIRKPFERKTLVDAVDRAREEAKSTTMRPRASEPPTSRRIRLDRAVLVVGEVEDVRAVREELREGPPPLQVATVQAVEDAIRALASIAVDAVAICGAPAMGSPHLAGLVAESTARSIPVVVVGTPPPEVARTPGLRVCRGSEPAHVVETIHAAINVPGISGGRPRS